MDEIRFDDIEFHPEITNCRVSLGDVSELQESIREIGLRNPLTVMVKKHKSDPPKINGKERWTQYFLVSGFRRYKAIEKIRDEQQGAFETVPVFKVTASVPEALVINLAENVQRNDMLPIDIAVRVKQLINVGFPPKNIAAKLGKSQAWVSQVLKVVEKTIPPVQTALRQGTINWSTALEMTDLEEEKQAKLLDRFVTKQQEAKKNAKEATPKTPRKQKKEKPVLRSHAERREARQAAGKPTLRTPKEIKRELVALRGHPPVPGKDRLVEAVIYALDWVLSMQEETPSTKFTEQPSAPKQ